MAARRTSRAPVAVQRNDGRWTPLIDATVDRDDLGRDFLVRPVRHVGNDVGWRRRKQAVATGDFLLGQRDAQVGRLAWLDQAGIAEKEGFVGDDLAGVRILERFALAENVPFFDAGIGNAGSVEGVGGADHHPVFLGGDDHDRAVLVGGFDDQWLRNEGFDGTGRDARNDLLDRGAIDRRLGLAVLAADPLAHLQARRAAGHV